MEDLDLYNPRYTPRERMPQKRVGALPPPVEQRPRCPYCGKPLRPKFDVEDWGSLIPGKERPRVIRWTGEYEGYGHFDTLRCGTAYANRVVNSRRAPAP